MTQQTITVTRAITRTKTIKDLLKDLTGSSFIGTANSVMVEGKDQKVVDFIAGSKSNMDKFNGLMDEYVKLKTAIRKSNENTFVELSIGKMSVAEVLVMKELLDVREELYGNIRRQNSSALANVEKVEQALNNELITMREKMRTVAGLPKTGEFTPTTHEDKVNFDFVEMSIQREEKKITDARKIELISGFDVEAWLAKELEAIRLFKEEIDYLLSESNAKTILEIE